MPGYATAEKWTYPILACGLLGAVLLLYFRDPVAYSYLTGEDHVGENATAIAMCLAALLFAIAAVLPGIPGAGARRKRIVLALFALGGFAAGMEELSWGQRLLGYTPPPVFEQHNLQGELTLHNFVENHIVHQTLGAVMLAWLSISFSPVRWRLRVRRWGVPLAGSLSWFWLIPGAVLICVDLRMTKLTEVGELAIAICAMLLGLETLTRHRALRGWPLGPGRRALIAAGLATLCVFGSNLLLKHYTPWLGYQFELNAHYYEQVSGLDDQALAIYEYMQQHPRLLDAHTVCQHAHLLIKLGRYEEADAVLQRELQRLEQDPNLPQAEARMRHVKELLKSKRTTY
ncbi:MAG: hypothetical protein IT445_04155 [Phycisphaeraceae bacterium]|nr:hypothetical protein [Phycisphaeraceae bacterium]